MFILQDQHNPLRFYISVIANKDLDELNALEEWFRQTNATHRFVAIHPDANSVKNRAAMKDFISKHTSYGLQTCVIEFDHIKDAAMFKLSYASTIE